MITGKCSDARWIKNAHLWPNHTKGKGLNFLELEPEMINHPRNFLRLHCELEHAFDRCQIILVPEWSLKRPSSKCFNLRVSILDPELKASTATLNGFTDLKWSELDGRLSHWEFGRKIDQAPYTRILAQHQITSLKRAAEKEWVAPSDLGEMKDRALRVLRHSLGEKADFHSADNL